MYELGTKVTFQGGTGRRNEEEVLTGFVNGKVMEMDDVIYVPVYVHATKQTVVVDSRNIVEEAVA